MAPLPPRVPLSSLFKSGPPEDIFKRDDGDDTDTDTDSDDDDNHSYSASRTQHAGQTSIAAGLTSSSASSTVQGSQSGQELGARSKSNAGAVAGGLIGGLICLAAIVFLFWRWRRKREGPKVKLEIDSTSPLNGEPPVYDHRRSRSLPQDDEEKSAPSSPTSPLFEEDRPLHFWQVHNASSSSLPAFESSSAVSPTKLDMLDLKKVVPTKDSSWVSADSTKEAMASSSFTSPSTSFPSGKERFMARISYSESEDFAIAAQVEVADLRRRVELLKEENVQLAEGQEKQSSAESPPAYNEKA